MSLFTRIKYLPYRVVRRFAIANVSCFFAAELGDLQVTDLPDAMVFTELTAPMLEGLCVDYPDHFRDEHRKLLACDRIRGFAVFYDQSLASCLWLAIEDVPGEINHDGHPATQMPLYLPDNVGYVFNVFVKPEYRGRRLYGAMITELANRLGEEGFTGLTLTTEGSNYRALSSVRRMGFRMVGRSMLFGIGGFTLAKYPEQPMLGGIQTGRYAGDTRA